MTKPRSTRIRKGVEVIDAGRRATVIRTTTLNVHGPMADLIYQDDESIGCAMIADLVRADAIDELLPAPIYTTVRVDADGQPLIASPARKFTAPDAVTAAELAASMILTGDEQRTASVSYNEDGVWTFAPSTGSPVHIRVTDPQSPEEAAQEAAEQAEADEHEQHQLDAMGKHEETLTEQADDPKAEAIAALFGGRPPEQRCPRCAGLNGYHGSVHVRHGNGGGHNEPCPNTPTPDEHGMGLDTTDSLNAEALADIAADEPQTWSDVDVVARTEQLHPATHPYRANEVVEYVGPSGIGSWVHGPLHFRRMVEVDMAEIMTMSGPKYIEVADLRRPAHNIAVELTPDDVARLFQALAQEAERLAALGVPDTHTAELRDRFAALHP
jgi:hypothetical protein